jgi:hypothetical protein
MCITRTVVEKGKIYDESDRYSLIGKARISLAASDSKASDTWLARLILRLNVGHVFGGYSFDSCKAISEGFVA